MFLLPPPEPPPAVLCGPPTPPIKGLGRGSAAFSMTRATRAALREMPGAVVVVEDEAMAFSTLLPPSRKLGTLSFRFFGSLDRPVMANPTLPLPVWMDPTVTVSGGNIVNRVYPLGGGRF